MKFNIIEFFPNKKFKLPTSKVLGTFQIELPELGVMLRGCPIKVLRDKIHVGLPHLQGWNHEKRQKCMYPMFELTEAGKGKELIRSLQVPAALFLWKWYAAHPKEKAIAERNGMKFD